LRREGRTISAEPVVLPRAFLLHADHGCQPAPGLPCALCFEEGHVIEKNSDAMRRENEDSCRRYLRGRSFETPACGGLVRMRSSQAARR